MPQEKKGKPNKLKISTRRIVWHGAINVTSDSGQWLRDLYNSITLLLAAEGVAKQLV